MKIDFLPNGTIDTFWYNRDNGVGKAEAIIEELKKKHAVELKKVKGNNK